MIKHIKFIISTLLLVTASSTYAANEAAAPSPTPMPSLAPALKNIMPAIVNVAVQGYLPPSEAQNNKKQGPNSEKGRKFESIGSGVIVDAQNGIIITNDHVIRNANLQ